jgi:hypothetical protein
MAEYGKDIGVFMGVMSSVLSLAYLGGANIELNPKSSNFLKIKTGKDTYLDLLGGYIQIIRTVTQVATGEKKDRKGEIVKLGEKWGSETRFDVFANYFINKAAPLTALPVKFATQTNYRPFVLSDELKNLFIPMGIMQDIELWSKDDPAKIKLILTILNTLGAGIQSDQGLSKEYIESIMEKRKNPKKESTQEEKENRKKARIESEEKIKSESERLEVPYVEPKKSKKRGDPYKSSYKSTYGKQRYK